PLSPTRAIRAPHSFPTRRSSDLSFPVDVDAARAATTQLLDGLKPSAIITIEKCSPNTKGLYHTGRGTDMSDTTAKVGLLVEEARDRKSIRLNSRHEWISYAVFCL